MKFKFTKMHGAGNDFILFDCFTQEIKAPESLPVRLCDRHFGVGGDGVVLLQPSDDADAAMRMFNPDGSESQMCGNAIRCAAKYLYDNRIVENSPMSIATLSGLKDLYLEIANGLVNYVTVDMGPAVLAPDKIPVKLTGENVIARAIKIGDGIWPVTCVSMGNPHAVVFCDDVAAFNVAGFGPLYEHNRLFPERVNVEFTEIIGKNHIMVRVWERGAGETLACGTGACAAAVAAVLNGHCDKGANITVELAGGKIFVNYTDKAVMMAGDCTKVFDGEIEL